MTKVHLRKAVAAGLVLLTGIVATPSLADWNHRFTPAPTNASRPTYRYYNTYAYNDYYYGAGQYPNSSTYPDRLNRDNYSNADASGDGNRAARQMARGRAALAAGDLDTACQAFAAAQSAFQASGNGGAASEAANMIKKNCTA